MLNYARIDRQCGHSGPFLFERSFPHSEFRADIKIEYIDANTREQEGNEANEQAVERRTGEKIKFNSIFLARIPSYRDLFVVSVLFFLFYFFPHSVEKQFWVLKRQDIF